MLQWKEKVGKNLKERMIKIGLKSQEKDKIQNKTEEGLKSHHTK